MSSTITDVIKSLAGGPLDLVGEANSVQRALENQIANLRATANPKNSPGMGAATPANPLQLLQQQLFQNINSIPSFATPLEQLQKQAHATINAQYDPSINMLMSQMGQAKTKSAKDQQSARDMYGALATDIASQIPDITNQMRQASDTASQRYDQAQQQSNADYQKNQQDQQNVLNQLGLQAAQQQAGAQSQQDQQYFTNQQNLQKQSALDALQQQGNSAVTYQHNLADTSRMAGDNQASALLQQLNDYLGQANNQLTGLQSAKDQGYQALLGQLQSSDAQHAQSTHQAEMDNLMKLYNFQLEAQKAQDAQQKNNQLFKGTNGPTGAANYLAQMMGSDRTGTEQQILQMINDTMADPNVIAGRHAQIDANGKPVVDQATGKPVTMTNTNQYIEDLLRAKMEQTSGTPYSTGDINTAINALLAYLGQQR